jgi:hypothetical protein
MSQYGAVLLGSREEAGRDCGPFLHGEKYETALSDLFIEVRLLPWSADFSRTMKLELTAYCRRLQAEVLGPFGVAGGRFVQRRRGACHVGAGGG